MAHLDGITHNSKVKIISTGEIGTFLYFVGVNKWENVCADFDGIRKEIPAVKLSLVS